MERLEELLLRIKKFNEDREWDQFHTPSNLAKSISIEANVCRWHRYWESILLMLSIRKWI